MDPLTKRQARDAEGARSSASDTRPGSASTDYSSGNRRPSPYMALRQLLLRYLSPILVDTVLNQAMFKRKMSPHTLTVHELSELAPDIMLGLRLFVDERQLPELMVSLAELLERQP